MHITSLSVHGSENYLTVTIKRKQPDSHKQPDSRQIIGNTHKYCMAWQDLLASIYHMSVIIPEHYMVDIAHQPTSFI